MWQQVLKSYIETCSTHRSHLYHSRVKRYLLSSPPSAANHPRSGRPGSSSRGSIADSECSLAWKRVLLERTGWKNQQAVDDGNNNHWEKMLSIASQEPAMLPLAFPTVFATTAKLLPRQLLWKQVTSGYWHLCKHHPYAICDGEISLMLANACGSQLESRNRQTNTASGKEEPKNSALPRREKFQRVKEAHDFLLSAAIATCEAYNTCVFEARPEAAKVESDGSDALIGQVGVEAQHPREMMERYRENVQRVVTRALRNDLNWNVHWRKGVELLMCSLEPALHDSKYVNNQLSSLTSKITPGENFLLLIIHSAMCANVLLKLRRERVHVAWKLFNHIFFETDLMTAPLCWNDTRLIEIGFEILSHTARKCELECDYLADRGTLSDGVSERLLDRSRSDHMQDLGANDASEIVLKILKRIETTNQQLLRNGHVLLKAQRASQSWIVSLQILELAKRNSRFYLDEILAGIGDVGTGGGSRMQGLELLPSHFLLWGCSNSDWKRVLEQHAMMCATGIGRKMEEVQPSDGTCQAKKQQYYLSLLYALCGSKLTSTSQSLHDREQIPIHILSKILLESDLSMTVLNQRFPHLRVRYPYLDRELAEAVVATL